MVTIECVACEREMSVDRNAKFTCAHCGQQYRFTNASYSTWEPDFAPIKAVAVLYEGAVWTLPRPNRHHHVIHKMGDYDYGKSVQGFITETGQFLNRIQAKRAAVKHKQILPKRVSMLQLFSEDMW